jgi:hypothetical protein
MSKEQWNHPMYIRSGNPETENEATLHYPGMLGKKVVLDQPKRTAAGVEAGRSKEYQFIHTDSSMTVSPFAGAVAWWAVRATYQVTTDPTTLGRNRVAGVFQNAITPGNYGFIQTGGPATVKFIDAVTVANVTVEGNPVIPSATAGKADTTAIGTAATHTEMGRTASILNGGPVEAVVELSIPDAG